MGRGVRWLLGLLGVMLSFGAPSLAPAAEQSARGGVLSAGFGVDDGSAYKSGAGDGVYLWGEASTEYRFRVLRSARDEIVSWHPLWQSFRFAIRSDRPKSVVSFETAVRGRVDPDRGMFRGEALYVWADLAPAGRWVSVRLGRQLLVTQGGAGFLRMDGAKVRFTLHHLGVETYAGLPLRVLTVFDRAGEEFQTGWGRDWVYGLALMAVGLRHTQLRFGLEDQFRDGELSRRTLGVAFHKALFGRVNIRTELSADLLMRRVSEAMVGVDVRPAPWLEVGGGYEHWEPSFDVGTIWSVFATDPYDGFDARVGVQPVRWLRVAARGGARVYPKAITRDNVPRTEVGTAFAMQQASIRLAPVQFVSIELYERFVGGAGGEKVAGGATVSVRPLGRRLRIAVRGDVQQYGFDLQPQLAGKSGSLALQLEVRPTTWLRGSFTGQSLFSPWLKHQFSVSASLDLLLGAHLRRGQKEATAALGQWEPALVQAAALQEGPFRTLAPGLGLRPSGGAVKP
ncbi:MAG TPA: hypothetical protein DIU15_18690 [Deltaproteobacteria bacterium]|nr:hypothetical protein [Deltaproteobacteria bacterium]HCP48073.1 hypothetical protein [Deltaproteobacteria bacterium]